MTKIFADSNYFIGRFNTEDSLHSLAISRDSQIEDDNPEIFISNLIFSEVVSVLSQRAGRKIATEAGEYLRSGKIEVIYIDEELDKKTWKIFRDVEKKNFSFVDASILAVMEYAGIEKLLSFDREDFSSLRRTYDFSFY